VTVCDDGDPCTADSCADEGACTHEPDATGCDDGDPCTIDRCDAATGACQHDAAGEAAACGPGKVCRAKACVAAPAGMVLIPGGEAWQGCNSKLDAACAADELPQRKTTLPSFWLDRFEATRTQYKACIAAKACPPLEVDSWCNSKLTDASAVNCLKHDAAKAYCAWRGARLPTEAEWDKAARGGCAALGQPCAQATPSYVWGQTAPSCAWTVKQLNATSGAGCGTNAPAPPGSRMGDRSRYGVHDLAGNVREWTADRYSATAYQTPWATQPAGPPAGAHFVARGGHFRSYAVAELRAGARTPTPPLAQGQEAMGVRCALDVD
jgi:iron(II)-dependent oxidoreductase